MAETEETPTLPVVPEVLQQGLPARAAEAVMAAWEGMPVLEGRSCFLQLTARSPVVHPAISMLGVETEEILPTMNQTIIRMVELEAMVDRLAEPVERAAVVEPVALAGG